MDYFWNFLASFRESLNPDLVNKDRSLRSGAPVFLGVLALLGSVNPHELPLILLSRFDYALPGSAPRAEGCHERVVVAPEHDDVRIRLVQVVLEQGEEEGYRAHFALSQPFKDATKERATEARSPPGHQARTAGIPRRRGAPPRLHNRHRHIGRRPRRPCRVARPSCGARTPSLSCRSC